MMSALGLIPLTDKASIDYSQRSQPLHYSCFVGKTQSKYHMFIFISQDQNDSGWV